MTSFPPVPWSVGRRRRRLRIDSFASTTLFSYNVGAPDDVVVVVACPTRCCRRRRRCPTRCCRHRRPCPTRCCRRRRRCPTRCCRRRRRSVPQTMLSSSSPVPQTMLSPSSAVPHTMLSPSSAVPHTMLSPSSRGAPHDVVAVVGGAPHDVVAVVARCPTRCCRNRRLAAGAPDDVVAVVALRLGPAPVPLQASRRCRRDRGQPPVSRWLPQMMCLLHSRLIGSVDARRARARRTARGAPRRARSGSPRPAQRVRSPGYACAVYCRIAFTRFGVSVGFACSISATVPVTTGAAMLVPLRLRYGL